MTVKIYPSRVRGSIAPPPSKSVSHRAIICACLAAGESHVENIAFSKDIEATIGAMRMLGAEIKWEENYINIKGIGIKNADTHLCFENLDNIGEVFCGESGSTLRFLIPLFSLCNTPVTFTGQGKLLYRPQEIYADIFAKQGLVFEQSEEKITINGALKSGEYILDGNVSSQFITGLLLALPLLSGDSVIKIKPPFESRSYVELTLQTLAEFGVSVYFSDDYTICITGRQNYTAKNCIIESDYSQAAFFAVLAAIKGELSITNMSVNSKQGDKKIVDILAVSNSDISLINSIYSVKANAITAQDIDLADCPDLGPILMVLLAFAEGKSTIYNAARLRIKESDRIACMEQELLKLGVNISSTADSVTLCGRKKCKEEIEVFAHNDHRIAMSLAVFGAISECPVIIHGAECVAKSYPDFFEDMKKIGIRCEILN